MSVGRFLDDAEAALRRADSRMRAISSPTPIEVIAVAATRDQLYRQLDRLLVSFARPEIGRHLTLDDAIVLLEPSFDHYPRAQVLGTGIRTATLGLMDPAPAHENHRGRITAASLAVAAESVSLAAEIVHTHLPPPRARTNSDWTWGDSSLPLTREANALIRGAQLPEGVAEIARLTLAAMQIDRRLLDWSTIQPEPLTPAQWAHLRQWTSSGFGAEVRAMAAHEPAMLLRHLQPAPAVDRTTGPREVTTWADAVAAVAATRSVIYRQPSQATLAVARAATRLGHSAAAAGWRLSGDLEPAPQITAEADRWRALSVALSHVADVRDTIAPEHATQLDLARTWVRQYLADPARSTSLADLGGVIELQQEVQRLCADLRRHLVQAKVTGQLMTSDRKLEHTVNAGPIAVAVQAWERAPARSPEVAEVMARLDDVAGQPVSIPLGSALRQTSASFASPPSTTSQPAGVITTPAQLVTSQRNGHTL